jgi:hypothetical protein
MTETYIIGHLSKVKKNLLVSLTDNSLEYLVPNIKDNLVIDIICHTNKKKHAEIVDKLPNTYLGMCTVLDDRVTKPEMFQIDLSVDCLFSTTLDTLAHELVHVKQYTTGQLRVYDEKNVKWKSKKYSVGKNLNYWFEPWEVEARGLSWAMVNRWAEANGYSDKPWMRVKQ